MMPIDLLGQLSPGYVDSMIAQIHKHLRAGITPSQLHPIYQAAIRGCDYSTTDQDSSEFETWIAMHQRLWVEAVVTAPRI